MSDKFHQEKIKSVLSKGIFLTQIDKLVGEFKSPILSWFLTVGYNQMVRRILPSPALHSSVH